MLTDFPVTKIIHELQRDDLLPGILFRTARKQCDFDIERLASTESLLIPEERQAMLRREIDAVIAKYAMQPEVILGHPQYEALVLTAVGAHHAGQLLLWRLLLEELMSRGLLRLMIATGTVAAGVDFPARTVVVTAHSKRGSAGFSVLTASEFQQMSGRAGRRGRDTVGFCLVAPSQFSDARVLHEVADKPPEPLRSAYFAAPSTMLNLLKFRNVDDLHYTVSRSLASFLDRKAADKIRIETTDEMEELSRHQGEQHKRMQKRIRRRMRDAELLEHRQITQLTASLEGLQKLGYVEPERGSLTQKGTWAAELCTSLVLELAEAINDKLFDDLTVWELAGIIGSISGDPHRPYFRLKPNPIKKELFQKMEVVLARVRESYDNPATAESKALPDAALTIVTWMESESWTEFAGLLRLSGVSEGDVARLVTQTADHLNQLSRLSATHPILADVAKVARSNLLRPPFSESIVSEAAA